MKLKPKYSIVIPVYKRIFGFNEALESALNVEGCQEIIVVDDNSDHNEFQEICESFGDERIRYSKDYLGIGIKELICLRANLYLYFVVMI
jgi:glycosyltransferase involved in cell wall biosynthesis